MLGRETAGFILFTPEPAFARGGYLRAIGVSPKFRRQGIGRKLLSFAEKITARQALHFFLCVSSFNRKAQAFYKNRGYTRVGKLPGLIKPGLTEYIYWKRLRSR
jgi:ribosomal protein S18 acetylase RimI-like enzyme